ncbi:MAG: peptide chain release factor N(5)-glutamine methyltransferase [Actinomycetota bacterium]|nr:peptide chain release factor N(5)-glutamine methyltransferase [Actinomycetota bacterium]
MTTVGDALSRTADRLTAAGCESARADAEFLLAHVLDTTRSAARANGRRALGAAAIDELDRLVTRRERREPLAYVLGVWGFRRLTLKVDSRVLVPRPETEVVVERCLARLAGVAEPKVLDVGTGSGAIALAIADEAPGARVTAIDSSSDALEIARENASRTGLTVEFLHGDLFDGLPHGPWDLVVSNPPYVRPEEIESLEPEVREWEPRAALIGEGATEAVARGAAPVLRSGGVLVLEVAEGDADRDAELVRAVGYAEVSVTKDLAGRDRVVEGILQR